MNQNYLTIPCILGLAFSCKTAEQEEMKPNIIIFHVDDLGWTDLNCYGSDFYETPNIDSLASKGIKFTNAYAPAAICSPSRASIQTGKYPPSTGITDWIRATFQKDTAIDYSNPPKYEMKEGKQMKTPFNQNFLPLEEKTIGEYLKENGYYTVHAGKWHLGEEGYYPTNQGYDVNIAGCDYGEPPSYFDPYFREGHHYPWGYEPPFSFPTLEPRKEGEYLTNRLTDEVSRIIKEHEDTSFFVFFNYYAVHTPIQGVDSLVEKYKQKEPGLHDNPEYAAMVEAVDLSVGRINSLLDSLGLSSNTLILFTSDNGGLDRVTDNHPLRAGKGTPFEGGIRVPFIATWRGQIQGNRVSDLPFTSMNILPTLADIVGFKTQASDGKSIAPLLFGEEMETVGDLFWHYPHYRGNQSPYSIIRRDSMKLIRFYDGDSLKLYNLNKDISEKNNLAEKFPGTAEILNNKIDSLIKISGGKLPVFKK
jgi:arylsulfatase A-like enzyme